MKITKNKLSTYIKSLNNFRKEKDKYWKEDEKSPLTSEQKKKFKGLSYFPPNPKFYFETTLDINIPNLGEEIDVSTTGGDKQIYKRAGAVHLKIEEENIKATIFEDPQQEQYQYYLLFKDKTTGRETYKNGRMLQIDLSTKSGQGKVKLIINFNYAYNPYSAYNDNWDCPITPQENYLPVRIEAGEKKFEE